MHRPRWHRAHSNAWSHRADTWPGWQAAWGQCTAHGVLSRDLHYEWTAHLPRQHLAQEGMSVVWGQPAAAISVTASAVCSTSPAALHAVLLTIHTYKGIPYCRTWGRSCRQQNSDRTAQTKRTGITSGDSCTHMHSISSQRPHWAHHDGIVQGMPTGHTHLSMAWVGAHQHWALCSSSPGITRPSPWAPHM